MKICDIVYNSIWYDPRVKKQILSYSQNGHEVIAVGLKDNKYKQEELKKLPAICRIIDTSVSRIKLVRIINNSIRLRKAIIESNPDIIHGNDILGIIPAYLACKKLRNTVLVYDSHEICSQNYNPPVTFLEGIKSKIIELIEKCILRRVNIFVAVSNSSMAYLKSIYEIENALVVTNSVDRVRILKREQNNLHDKSCIKILNHGGIGRNRGYETLLYAAELDDNKNHQYYIRGEGPLLSTIAKEKEIRQVSNFHIEKPVKISEVIKLAQECDIGIAITEAVCLNFKLSVSNKLFEYAAAGLPVIMSNIPEHVYLNDIYHFGVILEDDSPSSVVTAVNKLCNDDSLYAECCEGAHNMSEVLNWDDQFLKLMEKEEKIWRELQE